mgnify:CR=1 FL=1
MTLRGTRFGKYNLLKRIAVGGMAEIFLARQEGLEGFEKMICIKRIRPHLSSQPNFVNMFLNEAKLAARLNHPNIAQIYDLGRINDSYFIAMEYISGRDMSRIIPKAQAHGIPFPMVYALKVAANVCDGLNYAHTKTDAYGNPLHIVHRDVTPENCLVGFNGTVKLVDFGIAKANTQLEETQAGELKGKLSYMSPEQAMGEPLDHRSDIFSLGAILYEWITGARMFTGENEMAILKEIVDGHIYRPSYFNENVPEPVEKILMRALEKDREKRYQSAWDMQYDIDTYLASCEFTPSNIHLANFLKQIFDDEIQEEQEQLLRLRQEEDIDESSAYDELVDEEVFELDAISGTIDRDPSLVGPKIEFPPALDDEGHSRTPVGQKRESSLSAKLVVHLNSNEISSLRDMAERHGMNADALVREWVRQQLRWA